MELQKIVSTSYCLACQPFFKINLSQQTFKFMWIVFLVFYIQPVCVSVRYGVVYLSMQVSYRVIIQQFHCAFLFKLAWENTYARFRAYSWLHSFNVTRLRQIVTPTRHIGNGTVLTVELHIDVILPMTILICSCLGLSWLIRLSDR